MAKGKNLLLELANKLTGTLGQPTLPSNKGEADLMPEKGVVETLPPLKDTEGFSRPNDGYPIKRKSQDPGHATHYPGTRRSTKYDGMLDAQPRKGK